MVLPMSAWLSRVFGRKNYYMACVLLFTIASLLCGLAPTVEVMLFSRILQGIGGGGLAPVEQSILVDTFEPSKRASAFALYTIAIVAAPAIGPVLGGYITDNYNWLDVLGTPRQAYMGDADPLSLNSPHLCRRNVGKSGALAVPVPIQILLATPSDIERT